MREQCFEQASNRIRKYKMHVSVSHANLIYLDHTILFYNGLYVTTPSVFSVKISDGGIGKLHKE